MRTKESFYNILSNFIVTFTKTILVFLVRTILIKKLSQDYIGVNGLFTNILSILSLAELGVGTAINFSLYKPLAQHDKEKVSILMSFYKKAYSIIGIVIFVLGICLIPFLKYIVKETTVSNIILIYLLFLINTCFTYFISYKDTLINADQKNYKLTKINFIFTVLLNLSQVIILLLTSNYILFLIIQIIVNFLQRLFINRYITKQYKDIDFNCKQKLDKDDKATIVKNVKAMFFHKVGDSCINGTDNIIISTFINVATVGIYSNYLMIITYLNLFITMIYNGISASLGNLVATENKEKQLDIFEKINFLGFLIYGFSTICLINLFNPFIELWAGNNYVFSIEIVILIVINFYLTGMRVPVAKIKAAAGLFDVDKYTPLLQSLINLIVSILLVNKFGLVGVLIGTLISSIAIPCWQRPYLVYKHVFNITSKKYFITYFKYAIITLLLSVVTYFIKIDILTRNLILQIIIKLFIIIIIYLTIIIVLFKNKKEFVYLKTVFKNLLKRSKHE